MRERSERALQHRMSVLNARQSGSPDLLRRVCKYCRFCLLVPLLFRSACPYSVSVCVHVTTLNQLLHVISANAQHQRQHCSSVYLISAT